MAWTYSYSDTNQCEIIKPNNAIASTKAKNNMALGDNSASFIVIIKFGTKKLLKYYLRIRFEPFSEFNQ